MELGIIGLPNVGKSSLFNALTSGHAAVSNYPFCTIDPNVGIIEVPDARLTKLGEIYRPEKLTPTTIRILDIAGLVKGASYGEGLGNQFLSHIRKVDALIHIVRCFEDTSITHVPGKIDPINDIEIVNTELVLADLELLDKHLDKVEKKLKLQEKAQEELALLQQIKKELEQGQPLFATSFTKHNLSIYDFLTDKPVLYVANISEKQIPVEKNIYYQNVQTYLKKSATINQEVIPLCIKIEEEINKLTKEEQQLFTKELGIEEPALPKLIKACYKLLKLISFFTVVGKEVRAWSIPEHTKALQAAGKIHSDMEKGFIRAEIFKFSDLEKYGSQQKLHELGLVRSEGKDYLIQDGDVAHFRFNV